MPASVSQRLAADGVITISSSAARPATLGSTPDAGAARSPVKLIYIAGYGRSGTTLLDIALGEHPDIFGAGEISPLFRHAWASREHCACGQPVPSCPVWSEIVAEWQKGEPPASMDGYGRDQRRMEDIVGIGRWLALFGSRDHARLTTKLLRSVATTSQRRAIVDSSKLPGRGFALTSLPGFEVFVVHVVRDARGVAWSLKKPHARQVEQGVQRDLRAKPLLYTALRWMVVNMAAETLCRRAGPNRALRVRYEDFVRDPGATLERITRLAGLPASPRGESGLLSPQHQVAGSRHRMQRSIRIAADQRWREDMPVRDRRLVEWICSPLLRRYGYLGDRGGAAL